jgi:C1A family cysteine protease
MGGMPVGEVGRIANYVFHFMYTLALSFFANFYPSTIPKFDIEIIRPMKLILLFLSLTCTFHVAAQNEGREKVKRIPGVPGFSDSFENHKAPTSRGGALPTSYSLKKYAPPVGDQGGYGACTAWATAYAGMTILQNIALNREGATLTENECFSPQLTYDICRLDEDSTCSEGVYVKSALNSLVKFGSTTLEKYPYSCNRIDTERMGVQRAYTEQSEREQIKSLLTSSRSSRLQGFISISGSSIIENVKYYLSRNMPIVIAVPMYNSLESNTVSGVWNGARDDFDGGHAMCIVGYDDNKEGGAFEILNSWGEYWSSQGFVWFRYADFCEIVREAYALRGIVSEDESEIQLNDFEVLISAVGKKTGKSLSVSSQTNSFPKDAFKTGAFANTLNIMYPSEEDNFHLTIKSKSNDGFYVYAFNLDYYGMASIISPADGYGKYCNGYNEGLIIPSNQQSGISLRGYDGGEFCVLLSKKELDQSEIDESLTRSYTSLRAFVELNFNNRLALNQPELREYAWNDKLRLSNVNEINDIQPLFFDFQEMQTEDALLIAETSIKGIDALSIEEMLNRFKSTSEFYSYNVAVDAKRNWMCLGLDYKVKLTIDPVGLFGSWNGKYEVTLKARRKDIAKHIQAEVLSYFFENNVEYKIGE